MSLKGFTSPRTPEGRSSLVPHPPWHYVGAFLVVDYWADPEKAVAFLPEGIDPHPDPGRCAFVAADWQSCSEGGDELLDPSRSQYKEVFVVVNGLLDGEEVTTCAYIWVDRDFALARGWIQGFPKKLGSIWITRSFGLGGPADSGMEPGARFGVTCAAYERRVAEATVTLERPSARAARGGRLSEAAERHRRFCRRRRAHPAQRNHPVRRAGPALERRRRQAALARTARRGTAGVFRYGSFVGVPKTGGWEVAEEAEMLENAERIASEAVEMTTAKPIGMGLKDLVLMPAHAMLTIHEIVAHATELDRILGYEANYAGTSFVKLSDVGRLKYGSKLFNVTADRTIPGGMATIGYDDDGVKTTQFPIVREGVLVGLQTNRETAPLIGDKASKGCTSASSWRDYPFLRMPNVHVEPGPPGSPTPEQMIADTKDGVLIDGRGSYSIDQQRYNGQFGGNCFWEIKNGKKTRMVTDVTYNAITTDFWANLDAVSGRDSWRMYGTGGDAKGQPTQTNSISHGSPWVRIKKIMVGAAYA